MNIRNRRGRVSAPSFEKLESRCMLAVTFRYDAPFERLVVIGDSANDQVNINQLPEGIWVFSEDTTGVIQQYWQPDNPVTQVEFWGGAGNDTVRNLTDLPSILVGGAGDDVLLGGSVADFIYGQLGNDYIEGQAGDDWLVGNQGDDWITAGAGNDVLGGSSGNDTLLGDAGDDGIWGDDGDDWIEGHEGNDRAFGSNGQDTMQGGPGDDILLGDAGDDWMAGRHGNDYMEGGSGNDTVGGNEGDDFITGNAGHDAIHGDEGNDTIETSPGYNAIFFGNGENDLLILSGNEANYETKNLNTSGTFEYFMIRDLTGQDGVTATGDAEFYRFLDGDRTELTENNTFPGFVRPIEGTEYRDWTIVNYFDRDTSTGIRDGFYGSYTSDGHNGIDFTLPNFAAMDAGVDVFAAQSGTVIAVHDGEFDRWSRVNPNPGDPPNRIVIDHGNQFVTEYLQLKKDSILVTVGDTVSAGQKIAEVGSSGDSTDAHLHFTVFVAGEAVDLVRESTYWWVDPIPFGGHQEGILDAGLTDHVPTLAELVERPVDKQLFFQADGPGQKAVTWINLFGSDLPGTRHGDTVDFFYYRPDGSLYDFISVELPGIRFGWWHVETVLPDVPEQGFWSVRAEWNGMPVYSYTFQVT